jgi:hypothetical protein
MAGGAPSVQQAGGKPAGVEQIAADGARFDRSLDRAQRVAQLDRPPLPVRRDASPPLPDRREPVTFGPREPEAGIRAQRYESGGLVPYQIYRRAPFGYRSNAQLRAQLAATPQLDPTPFGSRPAAPANADRRLRTGDTIVVLDQTRLGFLEQQRQLLARGETGTALTDAIRAEIDYATMGQAVPRFAEVAATLRARAPGDAAWQRAIDQAGTALQAQWQAQGRTPDQIGPLLQAGERGDFGQVRQLAREQLVQLADSLGPDARPEAVSGAITARTAVYSTYTTGDPRYAQAIQQGAADATNEVLVQRPINQVLQIAEAGGEGWHNRAIARLRQVTDPATHTPQQVQAIMGDDRIKQVVRQSLRHAPALDSPEQGPLYADWTSRDTVLPDLAAIYSATLYTDGRQPGVGKALVDETAAFIVDHSGLDDFSLVGAPPVSMGLHQTAVGQAYRDAFTQAAGEGHVALPLAIAAKAQNTPVSAFSGLYDQGHVVAEGMLRYRDRLGELNGQAQEAGGFVIMPLGSVGRNLTPAERTALIDQMFAAYPDQTRALQQRLTTLNEFHQRREPIQLALDAYAPTLGGNHGFNTARERLDRIPAPQPLPDSPGTAPAFSLWFQRSLRLAAAETIKHAYGLPEGGRFDRMSRGFSTYLFAQNAAALVNSEFIDQLYVPMHAAMAVGELSKTVLPEAWRAALFGTNAEGRANPFLTFSRTNDALQARISALNVDDWTKAILRRTTAGLLLDGLDVAYTIGDAYNSYAYFTGNTQRGEVDLARGFAFAISTVGDAAFLTGSGALTAGAFLGRSLMFWNGVAIGLQVVASGINYMKGRYDRAHAFDAHTARAWQFLGVANPGVAAALGRGDALADRDLNSNAGILITEAFRHAGYSTPQMIEFINQRWSPAQAQRLARYARDVGSIDGPGAPVPDRQIARLAKYAREARIPFPDVRMPLPYR